MFQEKTREGATGETLCLYGEDDSIMSDIEQMARLALFIKYDGMCPECGSRLNQKTAQCTNRSRHSPIFSEDDDL